MSAEQGNKEDKGAMFRDMTGFDTYAKDPAKEKKTYTAAQNKDTPDGIEVIGDL